MCTDDICQLLLTISDATFEDSGQYICHAICWKWMGQSEAVNVTVYGGLFHFNKFTNLNTRNIMQINRVNSAELNMHFYITTNGSDPDTFTPAKSSE